MPLVPYGRILMARDPGILWSVDFTSLAVGPGGTLPNLLLFARALNSVSGSETVQTSDATMQSASFTADVPRIGQYGTNATTRGLVIEHTETTTGPARDTTNTNANWTWTTGGGATPTSTSNYIPASGLHTPNTTGTQDVADRIQATGSSRGQVGATGTSVSRASVWLRASSGTSPWFGGIRSVTPTFNTATASLTESWQRVEFIRTSVSGSFYVLTNDSVLIPGAPTGAMDVMVDFVNTHGVANGYDFVTEAINTGNSNISLVRNPERLYIASNAPMLASNRLSMDVTLRPKGASNQYGGTMRLWTVDANNYCEIDNTTHQLKVVIGGSAWTSGTAMSWTARDQVEISVAAGGGSLQSHAAYRVNGGSKIDLGSSGAPQGNISSGVAMDLMCRGIGVAGSAYDKQFTAWVQQITTYKNGREASWAA